MWVGVGGGGGAGREGRIKVTAFENLKRTCYSACIIMPSRAEDLPSTARVDECDWRQNALHPLQWLKELPNVIHVKEEEDEEEDLWSLQTAETRSEKPDTRREVDPFSSSCPPGLRFVGLHAPCAFSIEVKLLLLLPLPLLLPPQCCAL